MKLDEILDEVKIELTGYILDMEIADETLVQIVFRVVIPIFASIACSVFAVVADKRVDR